MPPTGARQHTTVQFIRAPLLGFKDEINSVLSGVTRHIDFKTSDGRRIRHWRTYVKPDQVARDPIDPSVYHLDPDFAVRRYKDGTEGSPISCHLYLNTEVTVLGTPAGELTIWVTETHRTKE